MKALIQLNFERIALLQVRQVQHDADKVALLAIVHPIFFLLLFIDYVQFSVFERDRKVVELALVVRVGKNVIEGDVGDWFLGCVPISLDLGHGFLVGHHVAVLVFHALVFALEPLFVLQLERVEKVWQVFIDV